MKRDSMDDLHHRCQGGPVIKVKNFSGFSPDLIKIRGKKEKRIKGRPPRPPGAKTAVNQT
jgi:hypothetical protein